MFTFTCCRCGFKSIASNDELAAAVAEANTLYGCDPDHEQFAQVCASCAIELAIPTVIRRDFVSLCPGCGETDREVFELTTSPNGPRPGGFTICAHCGMVAVVTEEMSLRPATRDDLLLLQAINPDNFMLLVSLTIATRSRIREQSKGKANHGLSIVDADRGDHPFHSRRGKRSDRIN